MTSKDKVKELELENQFLKERNNSLLQELNRFINKSALSERTNKKLMKEVTQLDRVMRALYELYLVARQD